MDEMKASSISGLREQIKANAVFLFPSLVASYRALDHTKSSKSSTHIPAADAFDIVAVIVGHRTWQAFVTYIAADGSVKEVASSDDASSLVEALQGLLKTTAYAGGKQYAKDEFFVGRIGSGSTRYEYGVIDRDLLEGRQDE
ncbi:hypothetical protein LTR56_004989 [Elasticomyces elasticus]|nr:hypothetical protein LTR22_015804 [Elasticomyces elasticus]KAK3652695.1 hypothetical protein LTR56_004989 [Elasticomyces elasticus]KAK4914625.1 hypothetical protein LTR49_017192 [Elasticomyces elasticus]KAK5753991.1 hypothetical protein LTS12_015957 [Elasticomyces elasticus]